MLNNSQYNLPPQNIELEESILGTVILYPDDDLFELEPGDFYRINHQKIYKVCQQLYISNIRIDLAVVANELKKTGELEEIGGASYLSRLCDNPPITDNKYYINQIKGFANLRRMIELSNTITKQCFTAKPEDVESIIDNFQNQSLKIGAVKSDNFYNIQDLVIETIERCEEIQQHSGVTGIPSGYTDLDSLLCGFQPSDLIILAGRPGMGKTAWALNCMLNTDKCSDFYSLEMARTQVMNRFLSIKSNINSQKFRSGYFSHEDWTSLTDAAGELSQYKINIDDTPCSTYQQIQRKARKSKKINNTNIIWIDYLSFIDGDKGKNKVEEIQTITRGLKSLAKELEIPIVLLCQLNRQCELRGSNKRPQLSDLRDSGAIEQDADVVLFLYRDEVYNKDENNPNIGTAEIEIAKQRNGPIGTVKLMWHNKTTKFNNLTYGME